MYLVGFGDCSSDVNLSAALHAATSYPGAQFYVGGHPMISLDIINDPFCRWSARRLMSPEGEAKFQQLSASRAHTRVSASMILQKFLVLSHRASLGTDPGVTVDIYYPLLTNYTIPGMCRPAILSECELLK